MKYECDVVGCDKLVKKKNGYMCPMHQEEKDAAVLLAKPDHEFYKWFHENFTHKGYNLDDRSYLAVVAACKPLVAEVHLLRESKAELEGDWKAMGERMEL